MELSGRAWVNRFPEVTNLDALVEPFRSNAKRFVGALTTAGATVTLKSVYRPVERAYLMHWCCLIARQQVNPTDVPALRGVEIQWAHPLPRPQVGIDLAASRQAAGQMMRAYGIVYAPALKSRHTERKALDMEISWTGDLTITKADRTVVTIKSLPRTGHGNAEMQGVANSYGVYRLPADRVHWSSDGH